MGYKVISAFSDLEDHGHVYANGDCFPRKGAIPTDDRIAFLASSRNLLGYPVIEKVEDNPKAEKEAVEEAPAEAKPKRRGRPKK